MESDLYMLQFCDCLEKMNRIREKNLSGDHETKGEALVGSAPTMRTGGIAKVLATGGCK